MKPVELIKEEVKNRMEQFTKNLLDQFDEVNLLISDQESKITSLTRILEQTKQELESLKNEYQKKLVEIAQLQEELTPKYAFNSDDVNLIIIYRAKDVFKYPREIIRWYFNELDLSLLSMADLLDSIHGLAELGDCEMTDELIFHISDFRLQTIRESEMQEFLQQLQYYLDVQHTKQRYSSAAVYYFMGTIYSLGWTPLLKEFVLARKSALEELVFKIDENSFSFREPLTLLKIYVDLRMFEEAEDWLGKILSTMVYNEEIELKDQMEFLFLATLFKLEHKALDFLNGITFEHEDIDLPEYRAFKVYVKAVNRDENPEKALDEIIKLKKEPAIIDKRLKLKIMDEMYRRIKEITEKDKEKLILQSDALLGQKQSTIKGSTQKQFFSVIKIKNDTTNCPYDSSPLKPLNTLLAKYTESDKKRVLGYVPVKVLYCSDCQQAYINDNLENFLIQQVPLKNLKIIQYEYPESAQKPSATLEESKATNHSNDADFDNLFQHLDAMLLENENEKKDITPPNSTVNSTNEKYNNNWQEESPLKKYGYSTNLTRQERWNILINKVIPAIGFRRTYDYISWFIKEKSKIKQKDFSRAINEWKYDLYRLSQYAREKNVQ